MSGGLTDRLGARRVLIGTQLASAVIASVLAYLGFRPMLSYWPLMIGALLIGLAFTFALPVQTAMISWLVQKTETRSAMAMNSVSYNAGRSISFLIFAAVIIAVCPGGVAAAGRVLVPTKPTTSRQAVLPLLALAVSVVVFTAGVAPWLSLRAAGVAGAAARAMVKRHGRPSRQYCYEHYDPW